MRPGRRLRGARAIHTAGAVVLLYVIRRATPALARRRGDDAGRGDGRARQRLAITAERMHAFAPGVDAELVIREGQAGRYVHRLIDEDRDVAILVLAAGTGSEGPGPLVSSIAARAAVLPFPSR